MGSKKPSFKNILQGLIYQHPDFVNVQFVILPPLEGKGLIALYIKWMWSLHNMEGRNWRKIYNLLCQSW